jgi:DNA repair protein RecN (Recombination protein N)
MLPLSQILQELAENKITQKKEMDLLQYQAAEIADAEITPEEDEVLETERRRLKNADTLHRLVFSAIETLYGMDGSILERLGEVRKTIEKTVGLDDYLRISIQGLTDCFFDLEEVTEALRSYLGTLNTDDKQLDAVESRLDLINKLKRKHGGSLDSLFEKRDAIDNELTAFKNMDEEIRRCEEQLTNYHGQAVKLSRRLSDRRKQIARMLSTSVEKELEGLRMTGTRFSINFSKAPCYEKTSSFFSVDGALLTNTGIDQAVFVISPNVGESLKPLSAIASGGELSRVVLAIKAILAGTDSVATVIFDEVDAGIGGAVAEVVGKKLAVLSRKHQLICITHHPQIARFGDHHYFIEKQVKNGRTTTAIRPMDQEERVNEIARMLDGEKITRTALEHARALLA